MKYTFFSELQEDLNLENTHSDAHAESRIYVCIESDETFASIEIEWVDVVGESTYNIRTQKESMWAFELFMPVMRWLKDHTTMEELIVFLKQAGYEEIK